VYLCQKPRISTLNLIFQEDYATLTFKGGQRSRDYWPTNALKELRRMNGN